MSVPSSHGRTLLSAFVSGLALHSLAVLIAWRSWSTFARGGILAWMDLPISLVYLGFSGRTLLAASLIAGGAQWGVLAALLAYWLGSSLRNRPPS